MAWYLGGTWRGVVRGTWWWHTHPFTGGSALAWHRGTLFLGGFGFFLGGGSPTDGSTGTDKLSVLEFPLAF